MFPFEHGKLIIWRKTRQICQKSTKNWVLQNPYNPFFASLADGSFVQGFDEEKEHCVITFREKAVEIFGKQVKI